MTGVRSSTPRCSRWRPTTRRTGSSPPRASRRSTRRRARSCKVEPAAITALTAEAMHDIAHFLRTDHLAQLRKVLDDPEASDNDRFVALDLLKNAAIAAGGVLPMCQDTGTAIVKAQEGPVRLHRRRRRGGDRRRRAADLPHEQPALQPDGAAHDVRGAQHRHQPAGRDQDLRRRRRRLLVPVHRQGRRQRQQVVPVPGDQGAAQRGDAAAVDLRQAADARHRRLPAVPPRRRRRRHVGRVRRGDGQAGVDALPRHAADRGVAGRPRLPRRRAGGEGAASSPSRPGIGAQFGGKYFCHDVRIVRLPRHGASCPVAMAVSCSADRQAKGKITADGVFLEQLETDPARFLPGGHRPARRRRRPCASTSTGRCPRSSPSCRKHPVSTRVMLTGPMVVARDIAHAKIKERLDAGEPMPRLPPRPLRVLRRAGQDAGGLRLGLVRPDDGRADGQLRRAVPGRRRLDGDARQGQPVHAGHRRRAPRTAASTSARSAARPPASPSTTSSKVDVLEYPELGMEAVWKIEVVDFPAFIVVDDKGNDFFEQVRARGDGRVPVASDVTVSSPPSARAARRLSARVGDGRRRAGRG